MFIRRNLVLKGSYHKEFKKSKALRSGTSIVAVQSAFFRKNEMGNNHFRLLYRHYLNSGRYAGCQKNQGIIIP